MDRLRNEVVRHRLSVQEKISDKVDEKGLKWFGEVECMSEEERGKYTSGM